ncbi:MAG TPA: hypothetical protein VFB20_13200 [Burkholderiales bacterium]|nr:hypothetical protein [Burkholderiales bacterium]
MSVCLETNDDSDIVVVAFDDRMDRKSVAECVQGFDRIPRIWWKHVDVRLRGINIIDANAVQLLRYLKERACGYSLRLVRCGPEVARALEAAAFPHHREPAARA